MRGKYLELERDFLHPNFHQQPHFTERGPGLPALWITDLTHYNRGFTLCHLSTTPQPRHSQHD